MYLFHSVIFVAVAVGWAFVRKGRMAVMSLFFARVVLELIWIVMYVLFVVAF